MLYKAPRLRPADLSVLEQVDALHERLRQSVQRTSTQQRQELRRLFTAGAVAASTSIAGYGIDAGDVVTLMDGGRYTEATEKAKTEALAYYQVTEYLHCLQKTEGFRYSTELFNSLHWMLQWHHHPEDFVGQWRTASLPLAAASKGCASYQEPGYEEVPKLMGEFVNWLNDDNLGHLGHHVLVRASMAHLNLIKIRPWSSGNGRMSRSLQALLVARSGTLPPELASVEEWLGIPSNTRQYDHILRHAGAPVGTAQTSTLPWIAFCLLAYHQQAQHIQQRISLSNECWAHLMDLAETYELKQRQVSALHQVAFTGQVRRSHYEKTGTLSTSQASRDMRDLLHTGLLTAVGKTKSRSYRPGPGFPREILKTAQQPLTLTNPYAS
ncbi:Fic family protein [Streptomyces klenkii]|uniref:Fic family protein n=1 Tax=Streptomyces klenkii TaxID=1420899 RepID=UPI003445098E